MAESKKIRIFAQILNTVLVRKFRYIASLLLSMTVSLNLQPSVVFAQTTEPVSDNAVKDSVKVVVDSTDVSNVVVADSLANDSLQQKKKGSGLTAVVNYKSSDSLVFSRSDYQDEAVVTPELTIFGLIKEASKI